MASSIIHTDKAPAAVGPYVQAIQAGSMLFSSGQLGLIPEAGALPEGVEAQARQSLANIRAILDEAGFDVSDVVKTTVFLKDNTSCERPPACPSWLWSQVLPSTL